ncbi:MAG TPA: hypothetical protein VGS80_27130 [Ktedonobacterales bacterium]|jgi:hypothetical protein|nr:hypothetical protein [Ktedonobacterales bacterium]
MGPITRWFRHLVGSMLRGCVVLALFAALVAVGASLVVSRSLPTGITLFFTLAIVFVSGLLGAVGALAWQLSHIGHVLDLAHSHSAARDAHNQ